MVLSSGPSLFLARETHRVVGYLPSSGANAHTLQRGGAAFYPRRDSTAFPRAIDTQIVESEGERV